MTLEVRYSEFSFHPGSWLIGGHSIVRDMYIFQQEGNLLSVHKQFDNVRIAAYDYVANNQNIIKPNNNLGIADFTKQLLEHMIQRYTDESYRHCKPPCWH